MNVRITPDTREVERKTRKLRRRTPVATAQELNTQRNQSRTRITRTLSKLLGVTPQKRIRQRVLLPRGGKANKDKLRALALLLVDSIPARWFYRRGKLNAPLTFNGPAGAILLPPGVSKIFPGSSVRGGQDVFRRKGPSRLPIATAQTDVSAAGYSVRAAVLVELAREWPARWEKRMRREIARAFG